MNGKHFSGLEGTSITGSKLLNNTYRFSEEDIIHFTPNDETVIVIEDMTTQPSIKRVAGRIRKMHADARTAGSAHRQIVWMRYKGGRDAQNELLALMERLEGATVIDAADLEEPAKNTYSRRRVQVRALRWGSFYERVDVSSEEMEEGGFYVPLERMEPVRPFGYSSPQEVVEILQALGNIPQGEIIYGAPKSLWKRFEGDHWVNVYDLIDDVYDRVYKPKVIAKTHAIDRVRSHDKLRFCQTNIQFEALEDGSLMKEALEFFHGVQQLKRPDVDTMVRLGRAVDKEVAAEENNPLEKQADSYAEQIEKRYPMIITMCDHCRHSRSMLDKLAHYVQVCDIAATAAENQEAA